MIRCITVLVLLCMLSPCTFAVQSAKKKKTRKPAHSASRSKPVSAPAVAPLRSSTALRRRTAGRRMPRMPVFDPTAGDNVDGDDLAVRRAAVEALGPYNGTVVVVDPQTGRILTIVNQKTALEGGFTPCSTIKLVTAFAALHEGLVERDTPLRLTRYTSLDLSNALAHSNNPYFKILGNRLGFERVVRYARQFGLGEKAGWGIEGERPGLLPAAPPQYGGVGMMTAYGEGIQLTPLELAALLSAIANGGTLYHLQYPRTPEAIEHFVPHVKRQLDITNWIDDVKVGMRAAVDFGTAQRAGYDPTDPILGKTGTCHDSRALNHLGWFGSFNDVERNKLVVVVLLTGGWRINGPIAAGVAGSIYKQLSQENFFASGNLISTQICCSR
ncbi:MAG TPA: penicillin-binding transpeptidase domain-containing protein [Bryobacteraceae bacterium]|nr:penicillin-binding transpeptidase domain-containing protein [Bryobacteraceae bacterium]